VVAEVRLEGFAFEGEVNAEHLAIDGSISPRSILDQ
jgi:hypothetical protein